MDELKDYQGNKIEVGGDVSVVPLLTNGTLIATINGKTIYAPTNSGGGGDISVVPILQSGTPIASIDNKTIYAPNNGGGGSGNANPLNISIQIPDVVYAVVGTELNIWNDTVTLSIDKGLESPLNYYTEWNCTKGVVTSRGFRFKPVSRDIGQYNCTCYIYAHTGELIDSKTFKIVVVNKSMGAIKNVLFVGDSTGTNTCNNIIANFNDTNRFTGNNKPEIHNESHGGWHWKLYAESGVIYQRVQVSGIGSLVVGAKYVDSNNNRFMIQEVNITNGSGNVLIGKSYASGYGYKDLTIPSGSLTKSSASYGGDGAFSYTDGTNEPGNPFWDDTQDCINITKYRQNKNINSPFDMVIIQLGINSNGNINTHGLIEGCIADLYDAFIADNPNCLFVLGFTPTSTNDHSAIGENYGAVSNTWGITYALNEYKFRQLYLELAASGNYPNMKVINESMSIDRYYGYDKGQRNVSDRDSEQQDYHLNYVHPTTSGYKQLADSIFASIIGLFS